MQMLGLDTQTTSPSKRYDLKKYSANRRRNCIIRECRELKRIRNKNEIQTTELKNVPTFEKRLPRRPSSASTFTSICTCLNLTEALALSDERPYLSYRQQINRMSIV
jgi:DNA-directed RNA polymerase specialized sigma subunit